VRPPGTPRGEDPVAQQEGAPGDPDSRQQPRQSRRDRAGAEHSGGDQHDVGKRAHRDDKPHMLTAQSLPQHEGVLGTDDHDEREPEA
jgi:hypothetical protein